MEFSTSDKRVKKLERAKLGRVEELFGGLV